jgi:hypothetical protein
MCVPTEVTVSTVAEGARESYVLVDKNFLLGLEQGVAPAPVE